MRVYGIKRRCDGKIVFTTVSRRVIKEKMQSRYDKSEYRMVILERNSYSYNRVR